jgi:hypothetical protein
MVACADVAASPFGDASTMKIQPTLILSGMATGAVAAAIALSPNASAQPVAPVCDVTGQVQSGCQSPGNYQGNFSALVRQPSQFGYQMWN